MAPKSLSRRRFLVQASAVGATALTGALSSHVASETRAGPPTSDPRWQIGFFTRPWANFDYHAVFDAIAEAGVKYVGTMTAAVKRAPTEALDSWDSRVIVSYRDPLDQAVRVGEEARKRGLEILSFYGGKIKARKRETIVADLRHLIDLAAAAGAKNVLLSGVEKKEEYDDYYGAVAACCDHAAEKKVGLTLKPHGGLNATGPQLRQAVQKVNHKSFTVWYDAGNILWYSGGKVDPVEDVTTVDGLVSGWCIKDYRHPKNVEITPGTGQVDFRTVFAKLNQGGFTGGPLLIETLVPGPGGLPHLLAEAKKARQFVEALVEGKQD